MQTDFKDIIDIFDDEYENFPFNDEEIAKKDIALYFYARGLMVESNELRNDMDEDALCKILNKVYNCKLF